MSQTSEFSATADTLAMESEDGCVLNFYHIGTIDYKGDWFVFFQPADPLDGIDPDEIVVFKLSGEGRDETLLPIKDQTLLDEVYKIFVSEAEDD